MDLFIMESLAIDSDATKTYYMSMLEDTNQTGTKKPTMFERLKGICNKILDFIKKMINKLKGRPDDTVVYAQMDYDSFAKDANSFAEQFARFTSKLLNASLTAITVLIAGTSLFNDTKQKIKSMHDYLYAKAEKRPTKIKTLALRRATIANAIVSINKGLDKCLSAINKNNDKEHMSAFNKVQTTIVSSISTILTSINGVLRKMYEDMSEKAVKSATDFITKNTRSQQLGLGIHPTNAEDIARTVAKSVRSEREKIDNSTRKGNKS